MSKNKDFAMLVADKMPGPDKLGKDTEDEEYADGSADDAEEGDDGDDEQLELDTMKDFRTCLRSGDDKEALKHLRDLVKLLGVKEDAEEG